MISESEIFVRDTVKINILKEINTQTVKLAFRLNDGTIEDYLAQIHNENSRVRVYSNFNISESPDGTTITVRPIAVENRLKIVPTFFGDLSEKKVSVVRTATKTEENSYEFHSGLVSLELIPSNQKYILRVEYSDSTEQSEISPNTEPTVSENIPQTVRGTYTEPTVSINTTAVQNTPQTVQAISNEPTAPVPQTQEEKNQKIEEEYGKDYEQAQSELEEHKKKFEIDSSVLEYYKDKDVKPIEELLKEISQKIDEAEQQIRLFIEAKQKKTMEIEGEIKSNKK